MSDVTRAEVCITAVADAFRGDGERLASAFGIVPTVGVRLAKLTFEPDLMMTDGIAMLLENVPPACGVIAPSLLSNVTAAVAVPTMPRSVNWSIVRPVVRLVRSVFVNVVPLS